MAAPRRKRAAAAATKQPAAPRAKAKRGAKKKAKAKAGLFASLAQYMKTKATGLVRRKPKRKRAKKRA